MKISIDPPPATELAVQRPWLKAAGLVVLIVSMALIAFDAYWPPYLKGMFLGLGIEQSTAGYLVYLAGYLRFLGIAVGAYLISKSRAKPLYPRKEEV